MPATPPAVPSPATRWSIEWRRSAETLQVVEPTPAQVAALAPQLSRFYNEPHNRAMLAHTQEMSVDDVADHYAALWREQARPLLLLFDGRLVGDADLRRIGGGRAEVAIMVGERSLQGRGLGTAYGLMTHALAFRVLALARTCVSILPENAASLRLFQRLGYTADDSAEARALADEPSDLTLSLDRDHFEQLYARVLGALRLAPADQGASGSDSRGR